MKNCQNYVSNEHANFLIQMQRGESMIGELNDKLEKLVINNNCTVNETNHAQIREVRLNCFQSIFANL